MKTIQNLHTNQTLLVRDVEMRDAIQEFISSSDTPVIKALGVLMLDKHWNEKEIEEDLGSEAIESLLDESEHMDYTRLTEVYGFLKEQGAFNNK
jgi:hypothetical protein